MDNAGEEKRGRVGQNYNLTDFPLLLLGPTISEFCNKEMVIIPFQWI